MDKLSERILGSTGGGPGSGRRASLLGVPVLVWLAPTLAAAVAASAAGTEAGRRTVVYEDVSTEVGPALAPSEDLWLTPPDLLRATRFVVKPEGVCREEMCVPLPSGRRNDFLSRKGRTEWFNLSAFARLLKQPAARDAGLGIWYFGPRPVQQNAHLASLEAPDFELPDLAGRTHRLSDFRGKKVLLVTWASW
jgi:AhpC/TSA family protein